MNKTTGKTFFPDQTKGSLVTADGEAVGAANMG